MAHPVHNLWLAHKQKHFEGVLPLQRRHIHCVRKKVVHQTHGDNFVSS